MHPYSRASIASALNSRTLSLHGALGRSKSSRENLLIHAHAALLRWLISCVSSPSSLTRPPKYRNWVVWAYFCPAASMTSRGGGDPPFFGTYLFTAWDGHSWLVDAHFHPAVSEKRRVVPCRGYFSPELYSDFRNVPWPGGKWDPSVGNFLRTNHFPLPAKDTQTQIFLL